ncbi:Ig-like domain-containing protein [Sporosarcina sp. GW1-11]|uniref:RCC1 domain-containing protein n=1 Tax=Sporosarcina sp. GW1-11 TaxID=2899126 RepID=UPI00294F1490|nr:Ig-like domain-containing protein [Sporosarcina sp. GW1-11]MDV6378755.1 Ig-like domain-containing protein [Sporosarcina sp. GW1-11]
MFTQFTKKYLVLCLLVASFLISFVDSADAYGIANHKNVVDAGRSHLVVLKEDGSVWSWGDRTYGQLGAGSVLPPGTPQPIQRTDGNRLSDILAISAGGHFTVALDASGRIWSWGLNDYGQLGRLPAAGFTSNPDTIGPVGMVDISAGESHVLAVDSSGKVWAWGYNAYGQLGRATPGSRFSTTPVQVVGLDNVASVAAGKDHSVALKKDGTVWAWGRDTYGQLGLGQTADYNDEPRPVPGLSGIIEIAAGDNHTLALKQDRTSLLAWGRNFYGQLGDGGYENKLNPFQVQGVTNIRSIAAGDNHTIIVKDDGSVWQWGRNTSGIQTSQTAPIQIKGITDAIAIGGGGYLDSYTLAVKQDGTVWQWDKASSDTTTKLPIFKKVPGIEDVKKLDEFPFVQGGQVLFKYIGNPGTMDVKVNGTFNNSVDLPMRNVRGNEWELQVELQPGQYEYGFRVNGEWTVDPLNRDKTIDDFGRTFSVLKVAPYATIGPIIDNKEVTFTYSSFDFNNQLELDAKSKSVSVMGNFGDNYHWIEIPMVKQPNNTWKVTRTLKPRDYYYSFVVRDEYSGAVAEKRNDPLNPSLQTDTLTGISRNTFLITENVLTKIPVAAIALSKGPDLDMVVGEEAILTARISPSNATNQNVNWTSSKPTVVTVEGGKLTAHTSGTATIIATSVDGGKVATLTVTVEKQQGAVSYPKVGYTVYDERFNVEPTKAWKIKLSQALDIKTFNPDSVYVVSEAGVKVPLGYQVSDGGKTMELRLQSGNQYKKGANYYLFIEDTVKATDGQKLKEKIQMKFQIKL